MIRGFASFACLLLVGVGTARADFIQSVVASFDHVSDSDSGQSAGGAEYALFTSYAFGTTDGTGGVNNGTSSGVRTVLLNLDVFAMHSPFKLVFNTHKTFDPGADAGPGSDIPAGVVPQVAVTYRFLLTLNNLLGTKSSINTVPNGGTGVPSQPGSLGKAFGPIAIDYFTGTVSAPFSTATPPQAGPNPYAVNDLGLDTTTSIVFGGRSGGGGTTPWNTSETFAFNVTVPASIGGVASKSFTLQFTANPEPGSLAFAGLLGIPALLGLRRRRIQVTVPEMPTAAV